MNILEAVHLIRTIEYAIDFIINMPYEFQLVHCMR